jgi:hypothetical protein
MNSKELQDILGSHALWIEGKSGARANLSGAYLSGANLSEASLNWADLSRADLSGASLSWADLRRADLSWADLSGANLSGANLSGAYLSGANLYGANLRRANLSGANLSWADLSRANLGHTVLDPKTSRRNREFAQNNNQRGIIAYRSISSLFIGNNRYVPGYTYVAPVMSWCSTTECHPGLYAGTPEQIRNLDSRVKLVKVYVRAGDYIVLNKGIRCKRFRVLEYV